MSNIFSGISKLFGTQEKVYHLDVDQIREQNHDKGLMQMGFSVVYYNTKNESRVNNFDNL